VSGIAKNLHRKCVISVQQCGGHFHGERPAFQDNKHHGNNLVALLAIYAINHDHHINNSVVAKTFKTKSAAAAKSIPIILFI